MSAIGIFPWLVIACLAAAAVLAAIFASQTIGDAPIGQTITWILSTEAVPPALMTAAVLAIHFFRQSHHTWRHMQ